MGKIKKQVEKFQADMARMQQELAAERVEATAGGGGVRAVANGHGELQSLAIDPAAVDPEDPTLLADMIVAAVNEAQRRARSVAEERMKSLTGGLGLPGLPGLPF